MNRPSVSAFALFLGLVVCSIARPAAAGQERLGIAPIRNLASLSESESAFITSQVTSRLAALGERYQVSAMASSDPPVSCDEACILSFAAGRQDLVLFIQVSSFGQGLAVLLELKEVKSTAVLASAPSQAPSLGELIPALEAAIDKIVAYLEQRHPVAPLEPVAAPVITSTVEPGIGVVRFESTPPGAKVYIGGKAREWGTITCTTPCEQRLLPKEYWVRAKLRFHDVWKKKVMVLPGDHPTVGIQMVEDLRDYPTNPYKIWGHVALWTGVGTGFFGIIAATIANSTGQYYNDSLNEDNRSKSEGWAGAMWGSFAVAAVLIPASIALFIKSPGDKQWWLDHQALLGPTTDGQGAAAIAGWRF